ncbi:RHS repeat domain-containing protein, partial [Marinifilum sp. D737]|uniref:RHS repeat domain-containing protein n=1 Tax=Marinifilum sp. D737 TaxID=2969628 RepID=UPI002272976C
KDHLGHTRVVVDEEENVIQETAYYPYGGIIAGLSTKNKYNYLYTGKEFIDSLGVNWYDHHARYYDPEVGRWFAIDPALQASSPYIAMGNNPMIYVDENGEFWHIVIGAAVGGLINLGIKAYQGKINSWKDGFVAFGIGAAAGAVGAATGGSAFLAAGGGAAGAGGFYAGAYAGAVGAAYSMPVQNGLNHAYFGDPLMTLEEYGKGIAFGALLGGTINGGIAKFNGRSFWNGTLNSAPQPIAPVATLEPKILKPNEIKTPMRKPESLPQTRGENLPVTEADNLPRGTFRKVDLPGERTAWVKSGKIISSGKPHGVPQHWDAMVQNADDLANSGNVVYLNKSINTALGQKIPTVGNWRPDVIGVNKNGVISITEVVSPSQTIYQIENKLLIMKQFLQKSGYNVNTTAIQPPY